MNLVFRKIVSTQSALHLIAILLFSFLVFPVHVTGKTFENEKKPAEKSVIVELNFGENSETKQVEVAWRDGLTALEALMHAADISTHPIGNYVFVTSIDGVKGERGVMAWYYKINGQSTQKLAIWQPVQPNDTITWLYVKDVCSATVDCKK